MADQISLQPTASIAPDTPEDSTALAPEMSGVSPLALQQAQSLADTVKLYKVIKQMAAIYSNSTMVPEGYQKKLDNCFVAIELAGRMNVSPILVMQNLYIVKGKPSWSGQACIALINGCGMFKGPVKFHWINKDNPAERGCYCTAVATSDGETLIGTLIDMKMVKGEGWDSNKKWQSMPEQMFMYRAASFFARVHCPNVLMGYSVEGEAEDIETATPEKKVVKVG